MLKRLRSVGFLTVALFGAPVIIGAGDPGRQVMRSSASDLQVHEWDTFTSVAGQDGRAVEWSPFSGPSGLPCFITILNPSSIKFGPKGYLPSVRATVRMETPVIYFYSGREQTVNASVRFPHGLITEWYPQGFVPKVPALTPLARMTGGITWNEVKVSPRLRGNFPVEAGKSHYYAARETDASPVQVGSQHEKFLFYRGLASFPVSVVAKVAPDGAIAVENIGGDAIGLFLLFEKEGERLGYRVWRGTSKQITMARPALTSDFDSLRQELQKTLTTEGLFPREAAAMIETWRDSWFEEGTRLLYIVPRAAVDAILPLEIEPRPAEVVRVFVGRLEIITPETLTEVDRAFRRNDLATLKKHGRFLEPIAEQLQPRFTSYSDQELMRRTLAAVAAPPPPASVAPGK